MRTEFHRQLHALNADLARMCESAGDAIGCATLALLTVDLDAAKGVLTELEILARLRLEVDRTALAVLARHAPVASYLRAVVGADHISSDADGGADSPLMAPASFVDAIQPPSFPTKWLASSPKWAVSPSIWPRTRPWSSSRDTRCRASRIRDDDEAMNDIHHGDVAAVDSR